MLARYRASGNLTLQRKVLGAIFMSSYCFHAHLEMVHLRHLINEWQVRTFRPERANVWIRGGSGSLAAHLGGMHGWFDAIISLMPDAESRRRIARKPFRFLHSE
jgi:hypothetical protein